MTPGAPRITELHADDICWQLQALPEPAPMPATEMAAEAMIDALAYRLIVVEAFDRLRALTLKLEQKQIENAELRHRIRLAVPE